mmetsp:Transcript_18456/g.27680  ORF Transcript_18456/g.27680 Transcript_18456/m.27680 type:complete len:136 (-) Transcript_18456:576-983(-)
MNRIAACKLTCLIFGVITIIVQNVNKPTTERRSKQPLIIHKFGVSASFIILSSSPNSRSTIASDKKTISIKTPTANCAKLIIAQSVFNLVNNILSVALVSNLSAQQKQGAYRTTADDALDQLGLGQHQQNFCPNH